jgi:hypothetical protein
MKMNNRSNNFKDISKCVICQICGWQTNCMGVTVVIRDNHDIEDLPSVISLVTTNWDGEEEW